MKIDIFDINRFIEINDCPEVSNPSYIEKNGLPTPDGIFSIELFGRPASYDRKTIFGYVKLNRKFFHPVVYKILKEMSRNVAGIISGTVYVKLLSNGELVEDDEGDTGIDFLIDNWKKIKWKESESIGRSEKLTLLNNLNPKEIFIDKWLIIPPFLRDLNLNSTRPKIDSKKSSGSSVVSIDEINSFYLKLINYSSYFKDVPSSFNFVHHNNIFKLQTTLLNIHEALIKTLDGKDGFFHKKLLGKITDYATRGVISDPPINQNRYNDQLVPFGYTGVPLSHAINLFYPYVSAELYNFLTAAINQNEAGITAEEVDYIKSQINMETIKKFLKEYIHSIDTRFRAIRIQHYKDPKKSYVLDFKYILGKPLNMTEILYMITAKVVEGKHVYLKRYPIENHHSIYPSRIKLLSTVKTKKISFADFTFENFPDMDFYKDIGPSTAFYDTIILNLGFIGELGADYDG